MNPPELAIAATADQVAAADLAADVRRVRRQLRGADLVVRATLRFEGGPPQLELYRQHLAGELAELGCRLDNAHLDPTPGPARTLLTFGADARGAAVDVSATAPSVGKRDQAGQGR